MKNRLAGPMRAAVLALAALLPLATYSQVSLFISMGPPTLPAYVQPMIPGDGYLWSPGYWAWSPHDNDYYWVPGTWVLAPGVGYLWTPGYWGFEGGGYLWHFGYWADHVGYYGGINYGYGYFGSGYSGGRWDRGAFHYNRSVNNIDTRVVHNVYTQPVTNNQNRARTSFNGGPGGVTSRPSSADIRVQSARHIEPTENQVQHERSALGTPAQRASVNHGAPQLTATRKPSEFVARGAETQKREAPQSQPAQRETQSRQPQQPQQPRQQREQQQREQQRPQVQPEHQQAQPQQQAQPKPEHAQWHEQAREEH